MELNNCVYVTGDSNHIMGREAVGNASSVWIFTKSYTPKSVEKNCIFKCIFRSPNHITEILLKNSHTAII